VVLMARNLSTVMASVVLHSNVNVSDSPEFAVTNLSRAHWKERDET